MYIYFQMSLFPLFILSLVITKKILELEGKYNIYLKCPSINLQKTGVHQMSTMSVLIWSP